jgi:predicted membrane protein
MAFSFTHIIIDLFKHMYNTAIVKFFIMILFTILLNLMCQRGLSVISWLIVFIPFITMTVITSIVLIVFGLSPSKGNIKNYKKPKQDKQKNKKCN